MDNQLLQIANTVVKLARLYHQISPSTVLMQESTLQRNGGIEVFSPSLCSDVAWDLFIFLKLLGINMQTYKELTTQIENLQKQAAHLRQTEIADTIASIKAKMKEYGITAADLGLTGGAKKAGKVKEPVAAKYRDSSSGATWSGRGKPPKWIAGKDRSGFTIR